MTNWKWIGAALLLAASFVCGYRYAAALYGADIAALREDYASRTQTLERSYREREKQNAQAVVAAWEERDRALADALDLRTDLDGVRDEAAALRRRLSAAPADPCGPIRAQLAECSSLCERGAGLLDRASRELQKLAADKDAIIRMSK